MPGSEMGNSELNYSISIFVYLITEFRLFVIVIPEKLLLALYV